MAGIDKIYGTPEQRREFKRYIRRMRLPGYMKRAMFRCFYPVGFSPLANLHCWMDRLLWKQPDLPWWVREAIDFQYMAAHPWASPMLSRDQIIMLVKAERFSVRNAFFRELDRMTILTNPSCKVAWPDALIVLTVKEWNKAYEHAMQLRRLQDSPETQSGESGK